MSSHLSFVLFFYSESCMDILTGGTRVIYLHIAPMYCGPMWCVLEIY